MKYPWQEDRGFVSANAGWLFVDANPENELAPCGRMFDDNYKRLAAAHPTLESHDLTTLAVKYTERDYLISAWPKERKK